MATKSSRKKIRLPKRILEKSEARKQFLSVRGSIVLLGDLEKGSREIAKIFQESIEKTAREL